MSYQFSKILSHHTANSAHNYLLLLSSGIFRYVCIHIHTLNTNKQNTYIKYFFIYIHLLYISTFPSFLYLCTTIKVIIRQYFPFHKYSPHLYLTYCLADSLRLFVFLTSIDIFHFWKYFLVQISLIIFIVSSHHAFFLICYFAF